MSSSQTIVGRGTRESTWFVLRRCLAMLVRLQEGPGTKQDLINAVKISEGSDAYGDATGKALAKRFDADKRRLWEHLGIRLQYDKQHQAYIISEQERPLLNLPDDQLETLAFLADTFQPDSPNTENVRSLIDILLAWLPDERRRHYERARGLAPEIDLRLRDSEEIAPDVWSTVMEARQARQELQFDYLSSEHEDGILRQHHVQPWDLDFTERGHYRLRAYCLFNDGPHGPWHPNEYFSYRLSRIVSGSARILPRKLPAVRPRGRPYKVIFELSPAIARFGVSQRRDLIGEPEIMEMDEGWVRVVGQSHDLFDLARNLLYYGANCRVLGGPELMKEMRTLVTGLAEIYQ